MSIIRPRKGRREQHSENDDSNLAELAIKDDPSDTSDSEVDSLDSSEESEGEDSEADHLISKESNIENAHNPASSNSLSKAPNKTEGPHSLENEGDSTEQLQETRVQSIADPYSIALPPSSESSFNSSDDSQSSSGSEDELQQGEDDSESESDVSTHDDNESTGKRRATERPGAKGQSRTEQMNEYRKKLEEDPTFIPTIGKFWEHDVRDEMSSRRSRGRGGARRGRGRGRAKFIPSAERRWEHDGYEDHCRRVEEDTERRKFINDRPNESTRPTYSGRYQSRRRSDNSESHDKENRQPSPAKERVYNNNKDTERQETHLDGEQTSRRNFSSYGGRRGNRGRGYRGRGRGGYRGRGGRGSRRNSYYGRRSSFERNPKEPQEATNDSQRNQESGTKSEKQELDSSQEEMNACQDHQEVSEECNNLPIHNDVDVEKQGIIVPSDAQEISDITTGMEKIHLEQVEHDNEKEHKNERVAPKETRKYLRNENMYENQGRRNQGGFERKLQWERGEEHQRSYKGGGGGHYDTRHRYRGRGRGSYYYNDRNASQSSNRTPAKEYHERTRQPLGGYKRIVEETSNLPYGVSDSKEIQNSEPLPPQTIDYSGHEEPKQGSEAVDIIQTEAVSEASRASETTLTVPESEQKEHEEHPSHQLRPDAPEFKPIPDIMEAKAPFRTSSTQIPPLNSSSAFSDYNNAYHPRHTKVPYGPKKDAKPSTTTAAPPMMMATMEGGYMFPMAMPTAGHIPPHSQQAWMPPSGHPYPMYYYPGTPSMIPPQPYPGPYPFPYYYYPPANYRVDQEEDLSS